MSEYIKEAFGELNLLEERLSEFDKKNVAMFSKGSDALHKFLQEVAKERKLPENLHISSTDYCGESAVKWAADLIFKENYARLCYGQFDVGANYPPEYILHAWVVNKNKEVLQTRRLPQAHKLKPLIIIEINSEGADKNAVFGYLTNKLKALERAAESTSLPIGKMFIYDKTGEKEKSFAVKDDRDNREQDQQTSGD